MEEINNSIIDSAVKFTTHILSVRDAYQLRKNNKSITEMIWIKKRPCIGIDGVYTPSALIIIFLN